MSQSNNNWIQNLWKLRKEQSKSLNLKYDLKTLSENDLNEVKNFRMENVMEEMRNTTYKGIDNFSARAPHTLEPPTMTHPPLSPMNTHSIQQMHSQPTPQHSPQPLPPQLAQQQLQQQQLAQQHSQQLAQQFSQLSQQHAQLPQQHMQQHMQHNMQHNMFPQQQIPMLQRMNTHQFPLNHMEPKNGNISPLPMGQMDPNQLYAQRMIPKLTKTTSANSYLLQNTMQQFQLQQKLQMLQDEQKTKHNQ